MKKNIELYLVRQDDENRTYLTLQGNVVFNYHKGILTSLSEDAETLELMDSMILDLKEQKSKEIKLVLVNEETVVHLRDLGRKVRKLYDSSEKKSTKLDTRKKELLIKSQQRFRKTGRALMDFIKRDLERERAALEKFDKLTDSKIDEIVDNVVSRKDY